MPQYLIMRLTDIESILPYVLCKTCGRRFAVIKSDRSLNITGQTVRVQGQSINNVNSLNLGPGGGIAFGPGGGITFSAPSPARYRCPQCGKEHDYAESEIHSDEVNQDSTSSTR